MTPITSPLQLKYYFVSELNVQANRSFDPKQGVTLGMDDVEMECHAKCTDETARMWEVSLRMFHQGKEKGNTPYFFKIEMVGFFAVLESYSPEKDEWLVKTNASSVLYSTAREVLRTTMANGPFMPLLLPTASFYTQETKDALNKIKADKKAELKAKEE